MLVISADGVSLCLLVFSKKHMFEISDLLCVLSVFHILQVLNLFLSHNQLVFALLISYSELLLEMFHLLNEGFFIF